MKTVYILGAGFSMGAGAPSQEKLVQKIFEIHDSSPHIFESNKIDQFKSFLNETMLIPETQHHLVPLEDIFTPIDRCILDNQSYRNLTIEQIKNVRSLIYYLIARSLQFILSKAYKDYIDTFAAYLVAQSYLRSGGNYKNVDNVSVISTNWDILLDTSIQSIIDKNHASLAVIDYCCHISSYWNDTRVMPGLEMLGKGGFNIKLIKLHGSLNWLQCSRCNRVYVDLDNKIAVDQFITPQTCRHCDKNFGKASSNEMVSNLIMPTFLKNLLNPQYKLLWQNASIELAEATKVVFIGYSLPAADFEMRQLLSRMIKNDAIIEVVDFGNRGSMAVKEMMKRYKVFFGTRIPKFHLKGAKHYIENHKMITKKIK